MGKTIVGLFDDFDEAQSVVNDLESAGFARNDISVVSNNSTSRFDGSASSSTASNAGHRAGSALGGAVGGAAEGAVIGGATGLAASLALLLIPGIGPIAAFGPLAATLSGASLGAVGGGIIGGLSGLGIPKDEAGYYAEGVRRGGTLVTLTTDDNRADAAMAIFDRHHPVDIEQRAAYYKSTGYSGYNEKAPHYTPEQIASERTQYASFAPAASAMSSAPASSMSSTTAMPAANANRVVNSGEEVRVPVVEEQLTVGKREVQRGGARIHTIVQERPVEEQVTLREEHVNVERNPVNRAAGQGDLDNAFRNQTIEVTERGEEAVVAKQARVVEEVVINKEATQRTETVRDNVRRTDVTVDELDADEVPTDTTTGVRRNV